MNPSVESTKQAEILADKLIEDYEMMGINKANLVKDLALELDKAWKQGVEDAPIINKFQRIIGKA